MQQGICICKRKQFYKLDILYKCHIIQRTIR